MINKKIYGCYILLFSGILIYPYALFGQHKYTLYIQQPKPIQKPIITSVTVTTENRNSIQWKQAPNENINYYNIYRNSSDSESSWIKVGKALYPGDFSYLDPLSYPNIRSYSYRISAVDMCENEVFNDFVHKTMKLDVAVINDTSYLLNWNPYEGFTVVKYKIYKGYDSKNLILIDSVSALSNQYTDNNVLDKNIYYQIEAIGNIANQETELAITNFYSRSNIAVRYPTIDSTDSISASIIQVYPNPMTFNSVVTFPYVSGQKYQLSILDLTGHTVYTRPVNAGEIEIERHNLKEGIYILQIASKKVLRTKLMVRSIKL